MTCIIGYIDQNEKEMLIAGDSCIVNDYMNHRLKYPKVFERKIPGGPKFLVGIAGDHKASQLIENSFEIPEMSYTEKDISEQAILSKYFQIFYDKLLGLFKANNLVEIKDNKANCTFSMIILCKGFIVVFGSDLCFFFPEGNFYAIGSGAELATGAMAGIELYSTLTVEKINLSMTIAEKYNSNVRGPFTILRLKY